jgi:hypothetical protein
MTERAIPGALLEGMQSGARTQAATRRSQAVIAGKRDAVRTNWHRAAARHSGA